MMDKKCENCQYWYIGRNGGYNHEKRMAWAECRAIMEGCQAIEIKFFGGEWSEFYVETQHDFYCNLWELKA